MLQLVTNDKFEKVMKPSCTIKLDDTVDKFTDFVAVGCNMETGTMTLIQNADAVTLGQAMMMVHRAFTEAYEALPLDKKLLVDGVLQGGTQ